MRVVADANVFVSAALGRSPDAPSVRIINAALDSRIELVMSPALLAEIADVLSRPRNRKRLSAADAHRFLGDVAAQTLTFADPVDPPSVCRDPDDDYLVALAAVGGADMLVTRDDDLLAVEPDQIGVEVLSPRQLIDRLGSAVGGASTAIRVRRRGADGSRLGSGPPRASRSPAA
jgi:putative PIN family toxin of toxin-antitoxin system